MDEILGKKEVLMNLTINLLDIVVGIILGILLCLILMYVDYRGWKK